MRGNIPRILGGALILSAIVFFVLYSHIEETADGRVKQKWIPFRINAAEAKTENGVLTQQNYNPSRDSKTTVGDTNLSPQTSFVPTTPSLAPTLAPFTFSSPSPSPSPSPSLSPAFDPTPAPASDIGPTQDPAVQADPPFVPVQQPTKVSASGESAGQPERAQAVVKAFLHIWNAYEKHAFGYDEIKPLDGRGVQSWGGFGAVMLDALDTMYLMNLTGPVDRARQWMATQLQFDRNHNVNVFETTIRQLGGLLTAYQLTGDQPLLSQASDLGKRLAKAFGCGVVPCSDVNLGTGHASFLGGFGSLAEFTSLALEFKTLSQETGDCTFSDHVEAIFEWLMQQPFGDGLYPFSYRPGGGLTGHVTLGARGDSTYEYLFKEWLLTGRRDKRLREAYDRSMNSILGQLLQRTRNGDVYIAEKIGSRLEAKMDHLVCFLPGVLALDHHFDPNPIRLRAAEDLIKTCYQMYTRTRLGIAPEIVRFDDANMVDDTGSMHSLLRPETVESLFIMFKVTGDQKYREWGWDIFSKWVKCCQVEYGFSGVHNVQQATPQYNNEMPTFFLAETLKYIYLLFAPSDLITLDRYVFNTEAHPLRIFPGPGQQKCGRTAGLANQ